MKVLYVSFLPPVPTWGTSMTFYRHFRERDEFSLTVALNRDPMPEEPSVICDQQFGPTRLYRRVCRTRFLPWFHAVDCLTAFGSDYSRLVRAARRFDPDFVFTIVAGWDSSVLVARSVARKIKRPLVASFNDWFNFGWFPAHPLFHATIERRFRRFYREVDLAFCTSEGMQEELGKHHNSHVLYPIGAKRAVEAPAGLREGFNKDNGCPGPLIAFAGSLSGWYGRMIQDFVSAALRQSRPMRFLVFGANPSWSRDFEEMLRSRGWYLGFLPFRDLAERMQHADVLLLPMGFSRESALIERTSFKTKFLDYLAYRRPIAIWGPPYSSAVRTARRFDSAEVCDVADAQAAVEMVMQLADSPTRQMSLMANADTMYDTRFNPDRIHAGFVEKCREIANRR